MNMKSFFAAAGLLLLAGCGHETDLAESREAYKETVKQENAQSVFGMKFDPSHDWCTTVSGKVDITADASVRRVQLLVDVLEITDPDTPSYVSRNSMRVINQAELNGRTSLTLYYDAPKDNLGLYVAFVTDESFYLRRVTDGACSFRRPAGTRGEKLSTGYTLPDPAAFSVTGTVASWASQAAQGWSPGEVFYTLNDYAGLKMFADEPDTDFDSAFKANFKSWIASYLPNGRTHDNTTGKVANTDAYNNNTYVTASSKEPVILTPIYKCDHPTEFGYEVWNSELYYYYYNPANVSGDLTAYLQALPKYKAIPFDLVFGEEEDEVVSKHGSYALLYFNTGSDLTPATATTKGSFFFPDGYKIGFMVKANTEHDDGLKQGELYGDGRLNNKINAWGNFASSGFKDKSDFPRLFWFTYEGKKIMSWESGTDADFNDIMIMVEGGTVVPDIPEPETEVFTYCFEDTEQGDFDLNDVVIKALRTNETTVEYRIVACGAHDELEIGNLDGTPDINGREVHELFGVSDPKTYINTDGSNYPYISVTRTVSADFSLLNAERQPYIIDRSTGVTVRLARRGQNPHGILVAWDFKYPTERTPVNRAYSGFNAWGASAVTSTDWYKHPNAGLTR